MRKQHIYDPLFNCSKDWWIGNKKENKIPIYGLYLRSSTTDFLYRMSTIIGEDPINSLKLLHSKIKFTK